MQAEPGSTGLSETREGVTDSINTASISGLESPKPIDRPNKYKGPPSTWRSWTENERQVATSLDQERAADLAIHLYNSHALKRRLWQLRGEGAPTVQHWTSKESWFLGRLGSENVGDGPDMFYPPKGWTAWPMELELVPREGEGILRLGTKEIESNGEHQYGGTVAGPNPSEILEDCIIGRIMNIAKEKYRERLGGPAQQSYENKSSSPSSSGLYAGSSSSVERSDGPATDSPEATTYERGDSSNSEDLEDPSSLPYSFLVPMADDEKAHTLLQPTARHLMSRLDSLLIGLQNARESYLPSSDEKDLKRTQDGELAPNLERKALPEKLPISKHLTNTSKRGGSPPKNPQAHTSSSIQNGNQPVDPIPAPADQKKRVGRPRKYARGFEKTQHEYYMTRKLAKHPEPGAGPSPDLSKGESASDSAAESERGISKTSPHPARKRRITDNPEPKKGNTIKNRGRLGLRDWSDVLGVASMVGWDPETVSRAATRCSTLFGEGIRFRTLAEENTLPGSGEIVEYGPNMILALARDEVHARARVPGCKIQLEQCYPPHIQERINSLNLEEKKSKDQWSPVEDKLLCDLKSVQRLAWSEIAAHFPNRSTLACESRWRRQKVESGFAEQQVGSLARSNRRSERDNPEECHMVGGVHNDGFLEPIKAGNGWRGMDKVKRKRRRKAGIETEESS